MEAYWSEWPWEPGSFHEIKSAALECGEERTHRCSDWVVALRTLFDYCEISSISHPQKASIQRLAGSGKSRLPDDLSSAMDIAEPRGSATALPTLGSGEHAPSRSSARTK